MANGVPAPARLIVLSGPSGAGLGAVAATVRRACPQLWQSVPVTTRAPRPGEPEHGQRIFVSEHEFDALASRGELLEWAQLGADRYGTPRTPVAEKLSAGVPALIEMDVAGARQLRREIPGALLVFLVPASRGEPTRRAAGQQDGPPARWPAADHAGLAAGSEFDVTLVNASVQDVCGQLVALMTAQPAS